MSRLIEGNLRYPDNSPIAGATIKFVANRFFISGVPTGSSITFTTNEFGFYSEDVLEGSYHVYYKQDTQEVFTHLFDITLNELLDGNGVPLTDPSTLEDLYGEVLPTTPVHVGCPSVPIPTGLTATSAFTTIIISWEGTGYQCHDYTEIWINSADDRDTASLLDTSKSKIYSHAIGHGATYYYWIRFVNKNGVEGNWNSTNGVVGTTTNSPGEVLDALQAEIQTSQLFSDLRTSINANYFEPSPFPYTNVINGVVQYVRSDGSPLISGDVWIDSDTNQRHIWDTSLSPADWVGIVDAELTDALVRLTATEDVADGGIQAFFEDIEPGSANSSIPALDIKFGDLWIDTSQPDPLTAVTACYRYESTIGDGSSTEPLKWQNAYNDALGKAYIQAYNTDNTVNNILTGETSLDSATIDGVTLSSYINNSTDNMVHVYSGSDVSIHVYGCYDNNVLDPTITEETGCIGDNEWRGPNFAMVIGDIFIETNTQGEVTSYRYNGSSWDEIRSSSNIQELADLTDNKRAIFNNDTSIPSDADVTNGAVQYNDLWIPPTDVPIYDENNDLIATYYGGDIYVCTEVTSDGPPPTEITFTKATRYTDLKEQLNELTVVVDNKIQTYAQDTVPYSDVLDINSNGDPASYAEALNRENDLWLCTSDVIDPADDSIIYASGKYYKYTKTANIVTPTNDDFTWTELADITAGLSELVAHQRTIYGDDEEPSGTTTVPLLVNDLWIPGNLCETHTVGELYTYTGTGWAIASKYSADILALSDRTIYTYYLPEIFTASNGNDDINYTVGDVIDWDGPTNTCTINNTVTNITIEANCPHNTPLPEVGDLWVVTDKDDEIRRFNGTNWGIVKVATLANVDTKITEQIGYCEFTDANGVVTHAEAYETQLTCEAADAASTEDTSYAWNSGGAIGSVVQGVSTTVNEHTTTVQELTKSLDGTYGTYQVKIDTGTGHISGFGLDQNSQVCMKLDSTTGLTSVVLDANEEIITDLTTCTDLGPDYDLGTLSSFIIAASHFAVVDPNDSDNPTIPFIVKPGGATGACYLNGEEITSERCIIDNKVTAVAQGDCADAGGTWEDVTAIPCISSIGCTWVPANTSIIGIEGSLVLNGSLSADVIQAGTIGAVHIGADTIEASHLDTNSVDANALDANAVTAKIIKAGKTSITDITNNGYFFSGEGKFILGKGSGNNISFDGTTLKVQGIGAGAAAWENDRTYQPGDQVYHLGNIFVCTATNIGANTKPPHSDYWNTLIGTADNSSPNRLVIGNDFISVISSGSERVRIGNLLD